MNLRSLSKYSLVLVLMGALSLSACGKDADDENQANQNQSVNQENQTNQGGENQTNQNQTNQGGENQANQNQTNQNQVNQNQEDPEVIEGFDATDVEGFASLEQEVVIVRAVNADRPGDELSIEIYGALTGGATGPGEYTLDEPNYDDCSNCVLIRRTTDGHLDTVFVARQGTLEITEFGYQGDEFSAKLIDVELIEVDFESGSSVTTPKEDGDLYKIAELELTVAELDGPPTFEDFDCDDDGVRQGFTVDHTSGSESFGFFFTGYSEATLPWDQIEVTLGGGEDYEAGQTYQVSFESPFSSESVMINTDCVDDSGNCDGPGYRAGKGEISIDELDLDEGTFKVTLRDLKLVEADAYGMGDPVIGGSAWCVDEVVLEGEFE